MGEVSIQKWAWTPYRVKKKPGKENSILNTCLTEEAILWYYTNNQMPFGAALLKSLVVNARANRAGMTCLVSQISRKIG